MFGDPIGMPGPARLASVSAGQEREEAALAKLALLDESTLLELSDLAASVCEYPNFATQISQAISHLGV